MTPPRDFVAATDTTPAAIAETVAGLARVERSRTRRLHRVWLDTADRRLRRAGLTLSYDADGDMAALTLTAPGVMPVTRAVPHQPQWGVDLPEEMGPAARLVDVRMLAPLAEADVESDLIGVLDDLDKTVARVATERLRVDGRTIVTRVEVRPLRGYDKQAREVARQLARLEALAPATERVVETLLRDAGRLELRGHSSPGEGLTRSQTAGGAFGTLFGQLLDAVEANIEGSLVGVDIEFLHDLRVAVRRARTALKLASRVVDEPARESFAAGFRWLGAVTTPARDLDVHLLELSAMRDLLPPQLADSLAPLHKHLARQQRAAQRTLSTRLRSPAFTRLVHDCRQQLSEGFSGPSAGVPLGPLADQRVRDAWRTVLRRGRAIDATSPSEALHDLRKKCKELRYTLEFFAGLYDRKHVKTLVAELKALQDNLGEFQDSEVQRSTVEGWAVTLAADGAPAATLVAIGRLTARLDDRQTQARAAFHDTFAAFARRGNRDRLAEMLRAGS